MIWQKLSLAVFVLVAVQGVTAPAFAQVAIGETPDNREIRARSQRSSVPRLGR